MSLTQLWCSVHGDWYDDVEGQRHHIGYCRPCWNLMQSWCQRQRKQGLPATVKRYREVNNLPTQRKPWMVRHLECAICYKRPRERGSFCKGCHNAYCQWSHKRREAGVPTSYSLDDFRQAVDNKSVVPRHEGEPHFGLVVRSI